MAHAPPSPPRREHLAGLTRLRELLDCSPRVEAGRVSARRPPPEYLLLGTAPSAWAVEASLLVVLGMFGLLQGTCIEFEKAAGLVTDLLPPASG